MAVRAASRGKLSKGKLSRVVRRKARPPPPLKVALHVQVSQARGSLRLARHLARPNKVARPRLGGRAAAARAVVQVAAVVVLVAGWKP